MKQKQLSDKLFSTIMKTSLLVIIFITVLFSVSCKHGKDDDKNKNIAINDTTPIGKKIATLSVLIGQNPKNPSLFHERAKLHMERMDFVNASLDMQSVLKLDSSKAEYYVTIADVDFAANQSRKSKEALEKALSLDPKNINALEKIAELYLYVQQYDKSISYLDQILKIDIQNPKAYFMKGMNFKEKGDSTRAIGSFQTAIEQKKDYYDAYQQLGMIYTAKNNELALQYFDGALRVNPKSEESLYGRAMCYQEVKHDYDKAIQDYTSITQINPNNANAHFALGYIHYQYLKVYDESIKHYSRAINAAPGWPEAVFNRGLAYETLGNIAAAKADYIQALKLRPDYKNAQDGLKRVK